MGLRSCFSCFHKLSHVIFLGPLVGRDLSDILSGEVLLGSSGSVATFALVDSLRVLLLLGPLVGLVVRHAISARVIFLGPLVGRDPSAFLALLSSLGRA